MKENLKDKLKTETIGVPSIKALSPEDQKAFAMALLSCAIDYYKDKDLSTTQNQRPNKK